MEEKLNLQLIVSKSLQIFEMVSSCNAVAGIDLRSVHYFGKYFLSFWSRQRVSNGRTLALLSSLVGL
jgi:hypothetical protein